MIGQLLGAMIEPSTDIKSFYDMASSVSGQDEPNRARARWSYLASWGLPAVSRKKNFPESHMIYPLLITLVRSRWPDIGLVLFVRVYGPRLRLGPYQLDRTPKKKQYPAILTGQAWSIKDSSYRIRGNFSCGYSGPILQAFSVWVPLERALCFSPHLQ